MLQNIYFARSLRLNHLVTCAKKAQVERKDKMDPNQWGAALTASLTTALSLFMAAIPRVIGFLVIIIIGWLISGALAAAVAALLRAVKFNVLATQSGFQGFIHTMGLKTDPSGLLANIVKWFVRMIVLVVAFDALGLPAVSQVLQQFLLWIPNLVVAVIVLVIAGLAANALGNLVRGSTATAGFSNPDLLASIARVAVWGFGIVVAVNQIGIAQELVNTLFMGFIGALALAAGLAFGLGGRETAAQILQGWYRQGQEARPKLERAADNMERNAERNVAATRESTRRSTS